MKFERSEVFNFEGALRGMRNPMASWNKSDSTITWEYGETPYYEVGPNDMDLARRLIAAGGEHRKFLRQIFVSVDITAPLYWWKEFDTYKVGTTANSTSTMHKLASTPITRDCFEMDDYENVEIETLYYGDTDEVAFDWHSNDFIDELIESLEQLRAKYNETKDKSHWHNMIQLLPSSFNQMRTVTMNYEVLINIYYARVHHKLAEWHTLCDVIRTLPYADRLILVKEEQ